MRKKWKCGVGENLSENLRYFPQFVTCVTKLYLPSPSPTKKWTKSLLFINLSSSLSADAPFKEEGKENLGRDAGKEQNIKNFNLIWKFIFVLHGHRVVLLPALSFDKLWMISTFPFQRWANSVLVTEYEYEYYLAFQKWPNTNTNSIRFVKNARIQIQIPLFGVDSRDAKSDRCGRYICAIFSSGANFLANLGNFGSFLGYYG